MIIEIECDSPVEINSLYGDMSKVSSKLAYRIGVINNVMEIHINDENLSDQKIIVNNIKQYMRDTETNYTMEIK